MAAGLCPQKMGTRRGLTLPAAARRERQRAWQRRYRARQAAGRREMVTTPRASGPGRPLVLANGVTVE